MCAPTWQKPDSAIGTRAAMSAHCAMRTTRPCARGEPQRPAPQARLDLTHPCARLQVSCHGGAGSTDPESTFGAHGGLLEGGSRIEGVLDVTPSLYVTETVCVGRIHPTIAPP
eukprot:COSAG01_NODE_94_length_26962_cov_9.110933_7_plen_113_part_00